MSDSNMEETEPTESQTQLPFAQHHAFIIGIDAYKNVVQLQTAVDDARRLAEVLGAQQHFRIHPPLLDAKGSQIRALLQTTLREEVGKDDRVFFYFAGHGIAADGDDGPAGYILPADADPTDVKTFIAMTYLQQALDALPCRHLLLVLDCCFSGAFKWSSQYRAIGTLMPKRIYKERFDRFIEDPAWQVITSAAYDQKALDVVHSIGRATGDRGTVKSENSIAHSPFAQALFQGLSGAADAKGDIEGDGVITATELYSYIRDQVEPQTIEAGARLRQTPGFFPLKKHDKGEFIFLHPHHRLNLPPIPKRSPYKGLESFNEADQLLFYGRDRVIEDLRAKAEHHKLVVVSGASGTGKSSVVKAGLLPVLRRTGFRILPVIRPGAHPLAKLEQALMEAFPPSTEIHASQAADARKSILLIDQFEEVITRCTDADERMQFDARLRRLLDEDPNIHRIILTVRADFEPQLNSGELNAEWMAGKYTVPPFSLEELKEVVVMPTIQEVLIFDPPQLVDEIIAEVVQSPGALPLLSYALSELYEAYRTSGRQDRALRKDDYDSLGGVMGALRTKADTLYKALPAPEQNMMRKILLRMVSVEGDLASKRVPTDDLVYSNAEKPLVDKVVEQLVNARLIVKGQDYIEPAHDALVRAWKTLHDWIHEVGKEELILGTKLNAAANEFAQSENSEFLWNNNPNLPVVQIELTNPRQWFNAKEIDFVKKSVARKKRRARIAWGITATIGIALSALTGWALVERTNALAELRRSISLRMAGEAPAMLRGARAGGDEQSVQQVLAARALAGPSAGVDGALLPAGSAWPPSLSKVVDAGVVYLQQVLAARPPNGPSAEVDAAMLSTLKALPQLIKVVNTGLGIGSLAFSHDGTLIVSGRSDGTLQLWNATNLQPIGAPLKGEQDAISTVALSADGKYIVSGSEDGTLQLWNANSRERIGEPLKAHKNKDERWQVLGVQTAAISPDGSRIASSGWDWTLKLWNAKTGKQDGEPLAHREGVVYFGVAFSKDGSRIVSAGNDATIRLWNAKTRKLIGELDMSDLITGGEEGDIVSVAFSPSSADGSIIVAGFKGQGVWLWNVRTGRRRALEGKPPGLVATVAFSADGTRVLAGTAEGTVRMWSATTGKPIGALLEGPKDSQTQVAFSMNGTRIVSGDQDGRLRLLDTEGGHSMLTVLSASSKERDVVFGATGALMALRRDGGKVELRSTQSGRLIRTLIGEPASGDDLVALSPDGSRMVSTSKPASGSDAVSLSSGAVMRLWNTETGNLIGEPIRAERHRYFNGASFSFDGLRFVSYENEGDTPSDKTSADGRLQLWDSITCKPIGKPLEGHKGGVRHAVFSPDGTRIVSAGVDDTLRLWNADTCKQLDAPVLSHANVNVVAFSPDGTQIVSGDDNGTVRLWNANSGNKIGVPVTEQARSTFSLSFSAAQIWSVAFSPDGSRVVSGSDDGLRLWNTQSGRSIGNLPLPAQEGPVFEVTFNQDGSLVGLSGTGSVILWPGPKMWAELLCSKLTRNISYRQWREWVSPQIDYQVQCPGLPVPE